MRIKPYIDELEKCISDLAIAINMEPLPIDSCRNLINYILYGQMYWNVGGREAKLFEGETHPPNKSL